MHLNLFPNETERTLRKERGKLYGTRAATLALMAARIDEKEAAEFVKYQSLFFEIEARLHRVESELLRIQAHQLGIEYPTENEKPEWWVADQTEPLLSETGLIRLNKLVKEEKRKNKEWWITILASLIGALTGLVGSLIALIAILHEFGRV